MNTDKYFSMDDQNEKAIECNLFRLQSRKAKAVRLHDVSMEHLKSFPLEHPKPDFPSAFFTSSDYDIPNVDDNVIAPDSILLAVTVNIKPSKVMNGRVWKYYSNDQQIKILTRMEKSIRSKNPSISLSELHFEVCPKTRMMHFHALYFLPKKFGCVLETFWARFSGDDKSTKIPWRVFHSEKVYDKAGWLMYIRKDASLI